MGNSLEGFDADPHEMPRHSATPLDDAALDDLLGGIGDDRLHEVLAAARAPGTAAELAGEEAALVAFRASASARAEPVRRPVLRRLLPVMVGATAAVVLGGVAIAASTGYLPNPLAPAPTTSPVASTVSTPWGRSASPPIAPSKPGAPASPGASPGPAAVPAAALPGLCTAYLAHVKSQPDSPWRNPGFALLSAAAGGDDRVPAFCTDLVDESAHQPTPSEKPNPLPTQGAGPVGNATPGASGAGLTSEKPSGEREQATQ